MDISREQVENPDGTFTTTTKVTCTAQERKALLALTAMFRDLAGHSNVDGKDVFDTSVSVLLTEQRRAAFCDGADMLEKLIIG